MNKLIKSIRFKTLHGEGYSYLVDDIRCTMYVRGNELTFHLDNASYDYFKQRWKD